MKRLKLLLLFLVLFSVTLLFDFAIAALVMWIWNMIIPTVFTGVLTLTYWQSFGLCVLISLFKINVWNDTSNLSKNK